MKHIMCLSDLISTPFDEDSTMIPLRLSLKHLATGIERTLELKSCVKDLSWTLEGLRHIRVRRCYRYPYH